MTRQEVREPLPRFAVEVYAPAGPHLLLERLAAEELERLLRALRAEAKRRGIAEPAP